MSAERTARPAPAVVVSGVTSEVGGAVVEVLWNRGASVLGFYGKNRVRARALEKRAAQRGASLQLVAIDLEDAAARQKIRRALPSNRAPGNRVDSFIGLAGFPARGVWREPYDDHRVSLFERIYRVDTLSHVWFTQALAPALRRRSGSAVLMSSAAAILGDELGIPFAMAKAANAALVKSLARILAPRVRVNGVAPGALETEWLRELTPSQRRSARSTPLLRRFGRVEEVAETIVSLALGPNTFQTGQILVLDGGVAL